MTGVVHGAAPRADIAAVADAMTALMRTVGKMRARLAAAAEHDVEWAAHIVLKHLQVVGPTRASEIAGRLQSDPSTVSRQVASLIKDGLLERRADPDDGRASLLVLTPKADAVLADHDRIRTEFLAHALRDWSDDDLQRFGGLLARFTEAYDQGSHWFTERIVRSARSARSGSDYA